MTDVPPRAPCQGCATRLDLGFDLALAFQPILDLGRGGVPMAYEALVRGAEGQGAGWVLEQVPPEALYTFDKACRILAVEEAVRLGLAATGAKLSVNVLPSAILDPFTCMKTTLAAARRTGFPTTQLLFELSEREKVADPKHLQSLIAGFRGLGFSVAIDDFGAGNAGLSLLADIQVEMVKLDMGLIRNCDRDRTRRVILGSVVGACRELGITIVAEGIETEAEYRTLREIGVELMQGYLFARPGFRSLPPAQVPGP